jgi:hypothetical protein
MLGDPFLDNFDVAFQVFALFVVGGEALLTLFVGVDEVVELRLERLNLGRQGFDLRREPGDLPVNLLELDHILEIRMHGFSCRGFDALPCTRRYRALATGPPLHSPPP